jgi:hypothetical protein
MMIHVSHSEVRVASGTHAHYASRDAQVFAVGDFRAREVINSLMQPVVDFVPTRTQKACKLWTTYKGPEWVYHLGFELSKESLHWSRNG